MMHKAWSSIEELPYCFSRSSVKFEGHITKKNQFWPELSVSGLYLQFEFTDGFEMMHKVWRSIEEVPYYFFEVIHQISRLHGQIIVIIIPPPNEVGAPCPSVCPSVCRRHGFRSISQVCFGISISNFICMLMVAIGRSLLIFSDVTFKMAAWRPYWIFWFPDSNFTLALNINFKLQRHNTYVYG